MKSTSIAVLLLAAAPALASSYDPYQDRTSLRKDASSSYDAAARAAGLPLAPERAADIKASLDESLSQAGLASGTDKSLENAANARADEMAGVLKGRGAPAPASAAKDLGDGVAAARARWKSLTQDHDALAAQIAALPARPGKSDLANELARAASDETAADAALTSAEASAPAALAAVAKMTEAERRARSSADERSTASAEILRLADALSPAVAQAKSAVDQLGQEPQAQNRTLASQKLSTVSDTANQMYTAADRACNRADDYRSRSDSFEAAKADDDSAQSTGAAAAVKAKAALDDAAATQADVRSRVNQFPTQ